MLLSFLDKKREDGLLLSVLSIVSLVVHCLDNRVAGKACQQSPLTTSCSGIKNYPKYLGIHFDRKLTYRQHAEATALKCKKGLLILKAVAKATSSKTMMFTLDHPSMEARQRWNKSKHT